MNMRLVLFCRKCLHRPSLSRRQSCQQKAGCGSRRIALATKAVLAVQSLDCQLGLLGGYPGMLLCKVCE